MHDTGRLRKTVNYLAMLLLLNSCVTGYIKQPFPEQPLNDKRYVEDRKDYAGSIDIKRRRNYIPFSRAKVYYNDRFIGRAGTRYPTRVYFDPGRYAIEVRGIHAHTDTVDFNNASIVNIGHGNFIDPVMVVYKTGRKISITKVDTLAQKSDNSNDRQAQ
jgi:hypothetical protein